MVMVFYANCVKCIVHSYGVCWSLSQYIALDVNFVKETTWYSLATL